MTCCSWKRQEKEGEESCHLLLSLFCSFSTRVMQRRSPKSSSLSCLLRMWEWMVKVNLGVFRDFCYKTGDRIMVMSDVWQVMEEICLPGPLAPPWSNRPKRKMTALSYSWTTLTQKNIERGNVRTHNMIDDMVSTHARIPCPSSASVQYEMSRGGNNH